MSAYFRLGFTKRSVRTQLWPERQGSARRLRSMVRKSMHFSSLQSFPVLLHFCDAANQFAPGRTVRLHSLAPVIQASTRVCLLSFISPCAQGPRGGSSIRLHHRDRPAKSSRRIHNIRRRNLHLPNALALQRAADAVVFLQLGTTIWVEAFCCGCSEFRSRSSCYWR